MRRRLVHVRTPLIQGVVRLLNAVLPRNPIPFWWLEALTVGSATDLTAIPRHFDFQPRRLSESLDHVRRKRPWRRDLMRLTMNRL
jgi:hypothetical protein